MSTATADNASASCLLLYALGAAVLAAPLAYRTFHGDATDADNLSSRVRRLAPWGRSPPPRYVYEPLAKGQFRLMHLLAGAADDDVVRVRLVVEAVDAAPAYHAVSYVWGDPGRTAGILCEGAEIRVTTNLLGALRRWRLADEDVVLWADAVCIDQRNTLEKTHQIALMADVYSRAASVLAWLGDDDAGLEGLEALVDAALGKIPEVFPDDPARNRANAVEVPRSLDWVPLRSLLGHAWFERKWVIQEAILNDQTWLHCGRFRLPLGPVSELCLRMATFGIQLHIAGQAMDPSSSILPIRLQNLAIMRGSHWYNGKEPVTLVDALKATRTFHCTDPRDHILGILAYATDVERDSILLRDNLLAVLALAPQKAAPDAACPWWYRPYIRWQKRRLPGLPSWVPDFRLHENETLPAYTFRHGKFSAGGAEVGTIQVIDDKVLRCSGIVVDVVKDRGVFWYDMPLPPKPARMPPPLDKLHISVARQILKFLDYYRACVRLASPSGSEDVRDLAPERLASLWKALTCERIQLSDRIDVDLSEQFKALVVGMETWFTSEDLGEANKGWLSVLTSGQALEWSIIGLGLPRRLSLTAESRLCMAPTEARVGDVICVLLGSEVPFVIRPTRRGMYELIGEAYVSGIMDGEVLSGKYDQVDIMLE
ncbi:heterokaryon incompatibility protein [Colletotrichum graminicola M1.001]|uniref:Heterokaryon incompatibility protein n=1 Tax=Colletotrichum graminicola (strain M1.001 / M2 / FGSC 10212) TaxID=645133 RepID=E3QIU9_COLGM|nr:heterokaryon incompatibility protein [Colletotrichum graminicola M1.001]EFQ30787.1 heterokaryon incompatibility protein [Colletotrichum graminicola M1.001]